MPQIMVQGLFLSQFDEEGIDYPVAYFSRKLFTKRIEVFNSEERNPIGHLSIQCLLTRQILHSTDGSLGHEIDGSIN